uniref:Uncharacterized protein n=1 Tax=Anguilla anguilla TaxID=7936 RepID=A0A0E9QZD7_ANGAN
MYHRDSRRKLATRLLLHKQTGQRDNLLQIRNVISVVVVIFGSIKLDRCSQLASNLANI